MVLTGCPPPGRCRPGLIALGALALAGVVLAFRGPARIQPVSTVAVARGGEHAARESVRAQRTTALSRDFDEWRRLAACPAGAEREHARMSLLLRVATRDPERAWRWARVEEDRERRDALLAAVLRTWSATNSAAALAWARAQEALDPAQAVKAVLDGEVDVGRRIELAREAIAHDAGRTELMGRMLIASLALTGGWQEAVTFTSTGYAHAPGWLSAAFGHWAAVDPEQAATTALRLADPAQRQAAFGAAVDVWAGRDAGGLADLAVALPNGPERSAALRSALHHWTATDPLAAGEWLARREASGEFDAAFQAIAEHATLSATPQTAARWAELIVDPHRRSQTMLELVSGWAAVDLPAARRFAETTSALLPAERDEMFAFLTRRPRR